MTDHATPLTLTPAHLEFVQSVVIIYIASSGADRRASLAHGYACRVDDTHRFLVHVDPAATALLRDIRAHRSVAVSFAQPGTHRALQFKATDAEVIDANLHSAELVRGYCEALVARILPRGFPEAMLRAYFAPPEILLGIRFTPYVAFDQTPGPAAVEIAQC